MKLSAFESNLKAEQDGVWVPVGNARILVARANKPEYTTHVRRLLRPHLHEGTLTCDDDTARKLGARAMACHLLLGWEGLLDENDKPIPYSPEKAEELLSDPKYKDFYAFVLRQANLAENFRAEENAKAQGN